MTLLKISFTWKVYLAISYKKNKFEYGDIMVRKMDFLFWINIFSQLKLCNLSYYVVDQSTTKILVYYDHYVYRTNITIQISNFYKLNDISDEEQQIFVSKQRHKISIIKYTYNSIDYFKKYLDDNLFDLILRYAAIRNEALIYIDPFWNIDISNIEPLTIVRFPIRKHYFSI